MARGKTTVKDRSLKHDPKTGQMKLGATKKCKTCGMRFSGGGLFCDVHKSQNTAKPEKTAMAKGKKS